MPRQRTWALRDVSLAIAEGESIGLVGESSSGKSTLARVIVGLETPTEGSVALRGQTYPRAAKLRRRFVARAIQMVFQDPKSSLNPRKNALQTLTAPLSALTTLTPPEQRQRALELLELVELPKTLASSYPYELSGGQAQRLAIARALAPEPRLLVLDEALSSLDVSIQARVLRLLHRLRQDMGLGYLFIGHDLAVVEVLCERVAVMHRGAIVERGPTASVLREPAHEYTQRLLRAVPRLRL